MVMKVGVNMLQNLSAVSINQPAHIQKPMNETLKKIRDYADQAHGEQMRKYVPKRYIVHPEEVMEICSEYTTNDAILAAALLHDVLEDTPITPDELGAFLREVLPQKDADQALQFTIELTDVYTKENYPQYNRRARKDRENARMAQISPQAQTIKYADIISNSVDIAKHDKGFAPKFLKECQAMLKKMDKGDPKLYRRATDTVAACIKQL